MPQAKPRTIELLAPARDLETALDAISHGADAVYIGAPRFGARQMAGNSLLCHFVSFPQNPQPGVKSNHKRLHR